MISGTWRVKKQGIAQVRGTWLESEGDAPGSRWFDSVLRNTNCDFIVIAQKSRAVSSPAVLIVFMNFIYLFSPHTRQSDQAKAEKEQCSGFGNGKTTNFAHVTDSSYIKILGYINFIKVYHCPCQLL